MDYLLKKSDKFILFVGICLGGIALLHPHLTSLLNSGAPGGKLEKVNGSRLKLDDSIVRVPELVDGTGKIRLNSAGVEKLKQLPGVGPVLAENIISYRKRHDGFSAVNDLTEVDGIGPVTMGKLRNRVTVQG